MSEDVNDEPTTEVCHENASNNRVTEPEEVEEEESKRDRMVEQIIVSPVTAPIEEKCDVEKEVYDKFAAIGVKVLKFSGHVDRKRKFKSGLVTVSPVNLNKIWGRRLG